MDLNKITGLMNLGNTCFMNSALQLLFNCPDIILLIINNTYDDNYMNKYKQTFIDYYNTNTRTLGPVILYKRYQKINNEYKGHTPEDAHEYLGFIIDDINELIKEKAINSLSNDLNYLYEIKLLSEIKCLECNYKSVTKLNEKIISLSIEESNTLDECICEFMKSEHLCDDNKWLCDKCKCKVDSIKNILVDELPKYLLISLKRFIYTSNYTLYKNNKKIEIPKELQISNKSYKLTGIVFHLGSINGGHYIVAITRNKDDWIMIDDTIQKNVTWTEIEDILHFAYILLYNN